MTRKDKAKEIMNNDIKGLSHLKTISHIGMATLRIPGSKRRLKRHLIDRAGNTSLSIGSMLAARKMKLDEDKAVVYSRVAKDLARGAGAPTLGKIIIRK